MGTPRGKVGWFAVLGSILVGGCFKKISVDPDAIRCTVDDDCPSGYTCTALGACCRNPADPACGHGDAAPIPDASSSPDVAVDLGEGGGIDGSMTTGGSGGTSRSGGAGGSLSGLGGATTGFGGSATSLGGIGGLGGSTGSGGAGGQIDAALDAPLDTPLGGSGGSAGVGTGGSVSSGGVIATGGVATGGSTGSGGMGTGGVLDTGGVLGTGGTLETCSGGATQCSGNAVQTCTSGQWGSPVPCGARQTCTGPTGTAKCSCNADPVCTSIGQTCVSGAAIATCLQDANGCFFQQTVSTCSNGACTGPAGGASCCTHGCTAAGAKTCASSSTIQTCALAANGCLALGAEAPCANGACFGAAGAASCCTNACNAGTSCLTSDTLQTCATGADGCTVAASGTCGAGLVCERIAPAECLDPHWAEWPVPSSYNELSSGAPNPQSFTNNGDGTVTDNITKLMWQRTVPSAGYDPSGALAYCAGLTLAGHSDWRLPSRIELLSIVDFSLQNPVLDSTYFPDAPSESFWSSTPSTNGETWTVHFGNSYSGTDSGGYPHNARCVR